MAKEMKINSFPTLETELFQLSSSCAGLISDGLDSVAENDFNNSGNFSLEAIGEPPANKLRVVEMRRRKKDSELFSKADSDEQVGECRRVLRVRERRSGARMADEERRRQ